MNDALLTQIYVCIYNDVIAEKKKKSILGLSFLNVKHFCRDEHDDELCVNKTIDIDDSTGKIYVATFVYARTSPLRVRRNGGHLALGRRGRRAISKSVRSQASAVTRDDKQAREETPVDRIIAWNERRANQLTFRRNRKVARGKRERKEEKERRRGRGVMGWERRGVERERERRKEKASETARNGRCKREAFTFNGFAPGPSRSSGLKILGGNEVS